MIRQLREARRQLAHGCLSGALGVYGEGVALLHVDAPRYREVAVVLQNQIDRAVGVQTGRDGHVALHHIPACGHIVPLAVAIEKILDNNAFQYCVFGAEALLAVRVQIAHGGLLDSVVHGNAQRPCVAALAVFCLDSKFGGSLRGGYAADFSGFFVQTQTGRQSAFINAPCDGRCADGGQGMAVSLACLAIRQGVRGHDDGVGVWHKPRPERGYIRRNAITGRVELVVAAKPLKVIACSSLRAGQTVGRRRGKFAAVFHDDPNAAFIAQLAAAKVKSNGFQPVRTYRVTVQNLEDGAETDLRVLARSVAVATEAARIVPANRTAPRQSDHSILSTRKNPVPVFDISVVLVQQPVPFVALGRAAF